MFFCFTGSFCRELTDTLELIGSRLVSRYSILASSIEIDFLKTALEDGEPLIKCYLIHQF